MRWMGRADGAWVSGLVLFPPLIVYNRFSIFSLLHISSESFVNVGLLITHQVELTRLYLSQLQAVRI